VVEINKVDPRGRILDFFNLGGQIVFEVGTEAANDVTDCDSHANHITCPPENLFHC
jgi:hypothetical protein